MKVFVYTIMFFMCLPSLASSEAECGTKKENVVIEKLQPISFEYDVDDGEGGRIKIRSQKFAIKGGLSESREIQNIQYLLNIAPGGEAVVLVYQVGDHPMKKIRGHLEYRTIVKDWCPVGQAQTFSEWRFIKKDG